MNEEKTYEMRFKCRNCFHEFTEKIPYGRKLNTRSGYDYHYIYYGLEFNSETKIRCPKCGVAAKIYKKEAD